MSIRLRVVYFAVSGVVFSAVALLHSVCLLPSQKCCPCCRQSFLLGIAVHIYQDELSETEKKGQRITDSHDYIQ